MQCAADYENLQINGRHASVGTSRHFFFPSSLKIVQKIINYVLVSQLSFPGCKKFSIILLDVVRVSACYNLFVLRFVVLKPIFCMALIKNQKKPIFN